KTRIEIGGGDPNEGALGGELKISLSNVGTLAHQFRGQTDGDLHPRAWGDGWCREVRLELGWWVAEQGAQKHFLPGNAGFKSGNRSLGAAQESSSLRYVKLRDDSSSEAHVGNL